VEMAELLRERLEALPCARADLPRNIHLIL
jgi:hypothetical protein